MFAPSASIFAVTLLALGGANAVDPPISGHDFDFTVAYRSGLKFSTTEPPSKILSAKDIALTEPLVTLAEPDTDARYVAFVEISHVPWFDGLDEVIYAFSWIASDLAAQENGTLAPADPRGHSGSHITHFDQIASSEVRNATVHVWRQTPEILAFLEEDDSFGLLWQLARVWSNTTSKVSYDFPRANIDFKVRNETGEFRGEVDENGASIVGYVSSTTSAATTLPTDAPSETTGSGSVPASTTAEAADPTESPSAASSSMAISGTLLLITMIVALL